MDHRSGSQLVDLGMVEVEVVVLGMVVVGQVVLVLAQRTPWTMVG